VPHFLTPTRPHGFPADHRDEPAGELLSETDRPPGPAKPYTPTAAAQSAGARQDYHCPAITASTLSPAMLSQQAAQSTAEVIG